MFEKMKAWQDEMREKGNAKFDAMQAKNAERMGRLEAAAPVAAVAVKAPKLKRASIGDVKTGEVSASGSVIKYSGKGVGTHKLDPAHVTGRIGDPAETARVSVGRVGGGAVVGTILAPGLGTLIGGGIGAMAKKKSAVSALILTDERTGAAYSVVLASNGDRAAANAFLIDLAAYRSAL